MRFSRHKSNRSVALLWGARTSRPPFSASGRKHFPLKAAGETPAAATETVALPNPEFMVATEKSSDLFFKSLSGANF
jgi:hypothetical protein